jgi:hypothetical protein
MLELAEHAGEGSMLKSSLVAGCVVVLTLTPTAAQQPTQAQRDAIRASCRSDFMANCASVQPGGKDALECLLRNQSKLSGPCRSAVNAIAAPASSLAPTTPAAAASAPTDIAPQPGQPAMPAAAAPSSPKPPHAAPNQKTPAAMRAAPQPAAVPAAAPAVAPLGPIRPMLPRRALMILAQCRPDQERLCAGVPAGGGKIFACLAANAQQLSPLCYDALARVSQ